jgi:hypothetical protein
MRNGLIAVVHPMQTSQWWMSPLRSMINITCIQQELKLKDVIKFFMGDEETAFLALERCTPEKQSIVLWLMFITT